MNQIMPAIMLADCPAYGYELILDMVDCKSDTFTRIRIRPYLTGLCVRAGVTAENLEWYDYEDENMSQEELDAVPDHIFGTSAVQFITTSSIVIHTLPRLNRMFLNLFSCDKFDAKEVVGYTQENFGGRVAQKLFVPRGVRIKLE
jgi:S-adenosylmethionine/arginine decarboxylase-like enzyme